MQDEQEDIAREVYDFERGIVFDRTKTYPGTRRMRYDIDFRSKNAPNPDARQWTYGASARNLESARKHERTLKDEIGGGIETRVVDAFTGKVIPRG